MSVVTQKIKNVKTNSNRQFIGPKKNICEILEKPESKNEFLAKHCHPPSDCSVSKR